MRPRFDFLTKCVKLGGRILAGCPNTWRPRLGLESRHNWCTRKNGQVENVPFLTLSSQNHCSTEIAGPGEMGPRFDFLTKCVKLGGMILSGCPNTLRPRLGLESRQNWSSRKNGRLKMSLFWHCHPKTTVQTEIAGPGEETLFWPKKSIFSTIQNLVQWCSCTSWDIINPTWDWNMVSIGGLQLYVFWKIQAFWESPRFPIWVLGRLNPILSTDTWPNATWLPKGV